MKRFWETHALSDLTATEWEALCDGCGWCCVQTLMDEEGGLYQTDVCCDFLDRQSCACSDYPNRFTNVPDCNKVSLDLPEAFETLPETCAYRRRYFDLPIPEWHPLLTGSQEAMHQGGHSVRGKVTPEKDAGELEDHIISWTPIRWVE